MPNWFALDRDGVLHNLGPLEDFDAANDKMPDAFWILDEATAKQWATCIALPRLQEARDKLHEAENPILAAMRLIHD